MFGKDTGLTLAVYTKHLVESSHSRQGLASCCTAPQILGMIAVFGGLAGSSTVLPSLTVFRQLSSYSGEEKSYTSLCDARLTIVLSLIHTIHYHHELHL